MTVAPGAGRATVSVLPSASSNSRRGFLGPTASAERMETWRMLPPDAFEIASKPTPWFTTVLLTVA